MAGRSVYSSSFFFFDSEMAKSSPVEFFTSCLVSPFFGVVLSDTDTIKWILSVSTSSRKPAGENKKDIN